MTLDLAEQRADLMRAREELAKTEEQLRLDRAGGSAGGRAQVDRDLVIADTDVAHLRREHDSLTRLVSRQAATRTDLDAIGLALSRAETTRDGLVARQEALDREATENIKIRRLSLDRLRATISRLETQAASDRVIAPVDGTVYSLPVRAGTRVQAGEILAFVGNLQTMQVRAFEAALVGSLDPASYRKSTGSREVTNS